MPWCPCFFPRTGSWTLHHNLLWKPTVQGTSEANDTRPSPISAKYYLYNPLWVFWELFQERINSQSLKNQPSSYRTIIVLVAKSRSWSRSFEFLKLRSWSWDRSFSLKCFGSLKPKLKLNQLRTHVWFTWCIQIPRPLLCDFECFVECDSPCSGVKFKSVFTLDPWFCYGATLFSKYSRVKLTVSPRQQNIKICSSWRLQSGMWGLDPQTSFLPLCASNPLTLKKIHPSIRRAIQRATCQGSNLLIFRFSETRKNWGGKVNFKSTFPNEKCHKVTSIRGAVQNFCEIRYLSLAKDRTPHPN